MNDRRHTETMERRRRRQRPLQPVRAFPGLSLGGIAMLERMEQDEEHHERRKENMRTRQLC